MGDLVVVEGTRNSPRWGVSPGPWLWATPLRILMVIDGRINTDWGHFDFGLGPVLETLATTFPWWVKTEVRVASRDGSPGFVGVGSGITYNGFRFTQPGFDIDEYDQIWFFGDHPGEGSDATVDDGVIDDPLFSPLSDAELGVVARWMDEGGGVFATGDHGLLGASMCSRIPRVGTMRRWTHAQGVPRKDGPLRHETLRYVPGTIASDWEGDRFPQFIRPVYRGSPFGPIFTKLAPHPLLCSSMGPIDEFPDHMHEGEVVPDADVDLGRTYDFAGYRRVEYPSQPSFRPRPQVIAHGVTTNDDAPPKQFGLISVYDGDPVSRGRVVVDSTWHHWLSMNLLGFRAAHPIAYQKMQAYYRNVALWLATPLQRASMLFAATFGAIAGSAPMAFQLGMGPWEIGEKALDVLGRSAPQCLVDELVGVFVGHMADRSSGRELDVPPAEPTWSALPSELVGRAIVGGIGSSLLELISEQRIARATGERPEMDPDAIRRHGVEGAALGRRLLLEALARAQEETAELYGRLAESSGMLDAEAISVPIERMPLRVVAERPTNPEDRGRVGGARGILRVRAGDVALAETAVDIGVTQTSAASPEWAAVEFVAYGGEEVAVELLVSTGPSASSPPVLFSGVLAGAPSGWLGWHRFRAAHPVDLWFRVELVNGPAG
jgi:hypothetical protein